MAPEDRENPIEYAAPGPDAEEEADEDAGSETAPAQTDADSEAADDETDAEADEASVEDVETLVVDPDDVVENMRFNGNPDDISAGKAVFTLSPPFDERLEPSVHHLESTDLDTSQMDETTLDTDVDDDEYNLRPLRFVEDGLAVLEQRPTPALAEKNLGEDATDEEIEAWIDAALETWGAHVRDHLKSTVDLATDHGIHFIDVEYDE